MYKFTCSPGGGVSSRAKEVELPKVPDDTCRNIWGIQAIFRLCAGYHYSEKGICAVRKPYLTSSNVTLIYRWIRRWRMQDFPKQGALTLVGGANILFDHFSQKLHKKRNFGPVGGGGGGWACLLHHLRSATDRGSRPTCKIEFSLVTSKHLVIQRIYLIVSCNFSVV